MIKRLLIITGLLATTILVKAQQEQQYTMYFVNPYTINPAVGGTEDFIDIKLGGRLQWVGLESAPKTMYVSVHSTLGKEFKPEYHHHGEHSYWHGVGGYMYKDQTGPLSRGGYYAQYSFNTPINKHLRLSAGAFAGMKQFSIDPGVFNHTEHGGDGGDVVIETPRTKVVPDASFGLWLYSKDYYLGASLFQVLGNDLGEQGLENLQPTTGDGSLGRHFFLQGGYRLPMGDHIDIIPSFAVKFVNPTPVSKDLNVKVNYADDYFLGGSWRIGDSFSIIGGIVLMEQWEVAYSYDLNTSGLRSFNTGTHEIILGYRMKHPRHIHCPSRFW